MTTLIRAVLVIHVLAGTVALVVAPIAMATVKGGRAHRRWGAVYYRAMAAVALSALVLAVWRPNHFLTLVAVFSFYFAFRARRVLGRKRPDLGERPTAIDWLAAGTTATASLALTVLGVLRPTSFWVDLGTVAIAFGAVGLAFSGLDLWRFVRPPADRNAWWFTHMGGMLGSYVAALSAFSVVNFTFLPTTVRWLWPTVLGTPLIALWIAYERRRLAGRRRDAAATTA
jgi:uncharacterized membrane protein